MDYTTTQNIEFDNNFDNNSDNTFENYTFDIDINSDSEYNKKYIQKQSKITSPIYHNHPKTTNQLKI